MIQFGPDRDVDQVSLESGKRVEGLVYLLHYLAGRGEQYFTDSKTAIEVQVNAILGVAPKAESIESLTYERLNELLLLVDESRISRAFFEFFFERSSDGLTISLESLRKGVTRFRGFAMLKFGNFRFAFRRLREMLEREDLEKHLMPWTKDTAELLKGFGNGRPEPLSQEESSLTEGETYLLGYIVRAALDEDKQHAEQKNDANALKEAEKLHEAIEKAENKARRNSSAYLASDYMDVYFATSMRQIWDFKETFRFVREVLAKLSDLRLRAFDPTQSHMDGVIEKGLVEALMLKRARCTVYLVQESDTLGKDSELAATLAQGKPVIAFIRSLSGQQLVEYSESLRQQPVSYFLRRSYTLLSEDFFGKPAICDAISKKLEDLGITCNTKEVEEKAATLLKTVKEIRSEQTYAFLGGEKAEGVLRASFFGKMPDAHKLMAACDAVAFDRRARTITSQHPLAMQVHLESGVGNGVLVVRDADQCARLLRGMLTNDMQFSIEPKEETIHGEKVRRGTILKEVISQSTFRYVTLHPLLSNAFWNFYLRDEDRFSARHN